MKKLYVDNGEISIEIKYSEEFDAFFSSMFPYEKQINTRYPITDHVFVVFSSGLYTIECLSSLKFCVKTSNFVKIPLMLIDLLDRILIEKSTNIVMHGAGYTKDGHAILFSQERFSGKSTLLHHMLKKENTQYIDDDILFINKQNMVIGPSFPMKMRYPIANKTLQILDENDTTVNLFSPHTAVKEFTPIKFIVFPKYTVKNENELTNIKGKKKTELYIRNLKSHIFTLEHVDFFGFVQNTPAFEIKYNSTEMAERYLIEIENSLSRV